MAQPEDVFVLGVGRTAFSRNRKTSIAELTSEAVLSALLDAGVHTAQLSAAFFANAGQGALEGQHMIRGQIALRHSAIDRIPIYNVENACASATTAVHLATIAVRAGEAEIVLVVGAECLASGSAQKSKAFFHGALDVSDPGNQFRQLTAETAHQDNADQRSIFMDLYAGMARNHMERFGSTQRDLAAVTSKNRGHAALNPHAQYRQAMTIEEVMQAREIVWPLTLPMCAPLGDGAAAAIVCSGEMLSRFGQARPVRIAAMCLGSSGTRDFTDIDNHLTARLARKAYEVAGVGPQDICLAEVHDATAAGEIIQSELLGLIPAGEGGNAASRGETTLGGRMPINLSGGLECNGHPVGATGLAQLHEVALQLRGEAGHRQSTGARWGLIENGGGFLGVEEAAATVAILERCSL